jgi:hypothetical protein
MTEPAGPPKSVGDVFNGILTDWGVLARFGAAVLVVAVAIVGGILLSGFALSRVGLVPTELELSDSPKMLFKQMRSDGAEYLFAVQPTGWQETDINVQDGDEIDIRADGQVIISLLQITDFRDMRRRFEDRVDASHKAQVRARDTSYVPERYFTRNETDSLKGVLTRGWIGPAGHPGPVGMIDSRYAGRTKNKILPGEPYAALIATVHDKSDPPRRADGFASAFYVGRSHHTTWHGKSGKLWFIVNDVLDDADPELPDKFFNDNFGMFLVRVRVKH